MALTARRRDGTAEPDYPYLPVGHAHNDYRHRRPLTSALHFGYASVEADVWPVDGDLLVGHGRRGLSRRRTLAGLYLEPLATRIHRLGAIYPGTGGGLQLLVEAKAAPRLCYALLARQLRPHADLLTTYRHGTVHSGAITVVLTGAGTPHELVAADRDRVLFCDASFAEVTAKRLPPELVPLVSERWSSLFRWRGIGRFPPVERDRLREVVARAHAAGRTVRFWGCPGWHPAVRRALWRELLAAGVDFVGSDQLREFADFAAARPASDV